MMKKAIKALITIASLTAGFASSNAHASIVIAGTRVIYRGDDSEQTVKLTNEGGLPALTQVWIDNGDPNASPSSIAVPFTVTPPVSRVDPGKGQTLRILYMGEPLPQDRESVFWLNVLEVPPKPVGAAADNNRLKMAFRSRIKLFFRPVGLKGSADNAPSQVHWRLVQAGGHAAIEARNPSAYHVTFASIELTGDGKTARFDDGGMVGPGETQTFPLAGAIPSPAVAKVRYQTINDYGGPAAGQATLDTPPLN